MPIPGHEVEDLTEAPYDRRGAKQDNANRPKVLPVCLTYVILSEQGGVPWSGCWIR